MTNTHTAWYTDDAQVEVERLSSALDTATEEIERLTRERDRLTDTTCNGWSNYATWRVNLELISDYADSLDRDRQYFRDTADLADHFSEYVDEVITRGDELEGLAVDYARSFVSDVNWYEIAEHYPELIEPDDDEGDA
jgi:hypothetical protein